MPNIRASPRPRWLAEGIDVAWGGESAIGAAATTLGSRGAREGRVGVIGPLTFEQHAVLTTRFGSVVSLNRGYVGLRIIKSAEEIDWLRLGAWFCDRAVAALRDGLKPGLTERELADLVERAYVADGGTTVIRFFGVPPTHH